MTLHFIGLGLDKKGINLRGKEIIEKCDRVFLDKYTSMIPGLDDKKIIPASRKMVEKESDKIIGPAKEEDVAFLVVGDVFSATTHSDLWIRAKKQGVKTNIVHNASILSAISCTGLHIYKFGKTASIPFPEKNWMPKTPYEVLEQNKKINAHTLILLDIKKERFMTVGQAIDYLVEIEKNKNAGIFTEETPCVGCARIGTQDQIIRYGKSREIKDISFGDPLHCLVVPAELHFMEKEALEIWNSNP